MNLAHARFFNFVDANDGVDGDEAALYCFKFGFQALFTGINDDRTLGAENNFFHDHKTIQIRLIDLSGKDFVDFVLIDE